MEKEENDVHFTLMINAKFTLNSIFSSKDYNNLSLDRNSAREEAEEFRKHKQRFLSPAATGQLEKFDQREEQSETHDR